ncbi:hypothetical protein AB0I75_36410 [Streptomyces sp. NPDC050273]|uniref:hypothetical protein n=1 Tax=Streptomyces sp. NPDC050273 TaxID=3154933 RepID=UPI003441A0C1
MNDHHGLIHYLRGTCEAAAELLVLTPGNRPTALPDTLATGRAGIILNALDEYGHSRSRDYARERRTLKTFGHSCEELDLRDYFATPEEVPERLEGFDLLRSSGSMRSCWPVP